VKGVSLTDDAFIVISCPTLIVALEGFSVTEYAHNGNRIGIAKNAIVLLKKKLAFFIFTGLLGIRKGVKPSDAYSLIWHRQAPCNLTSTDIVHAQTGMNFS